MEKLTRVVSQAVVLNRADIDTDQIIPKQFLKRTERSGFGQYLFYDRRYRIDEAGSRTEREDFELNRPEARSAQILIGGSNFGCGSSREHAVWALQEYGFRTVLAESFADIFFSNCFENGLLPIRLASDFLDRIRRAAEAGACLTVDLERCEIAFQDEVTPFTIEEDRRRALLEGQDFIDRTLSQRTQIESYEQSVKTSFRNWEIVVA